uniref:Uncharacterized protein n=1 Tax=Suricata suricatta TaxID=37032 RepID=A0A673TFZ9_SURSU
MVGILCSTAQRLTGRLQTVTNGVESLICTDWMCHKFIKSRIADKVFQPSPTHHEKYGGDPRHPHKLHIATRMKSTKRSHTSQVHKNVLSGSTKLKVVKHFFKNMLLTTGSLTCILATILCSSKNKKTKTEQEAHLKTLNPQLEQKTVGPGRHSWML